MPRTERQSHGFIFQNWIIGKFLDMAYTSKWDIPKEINHISNKNISIKTAKWKAGVGLSDALKQFDIDDDFQLLVAFYKGGTNVRKKVVNMQLIDISKEKWKELWGNMTKDKLKEFDSFIKSREHRNLTGSRLNEFRAEVQRRKRDMLSWYNGKIVLNPKIDSKNQRRLQCGIPFKTLFEEFGLNKEIMRTYTLWGEEIILSTIGLE